MELWIRSQDKMNLVKIEQINVSYRNNKQIIANYKVLDKSTDFYQLLGEYKSKERALEVLDEIKYKIQCMNDDFYYKEGYETDTKVYDGYKKQHKDTVYQMPEY